MKSIFKEKLLLVIAILFAFTAQSQTPTIGLRYTDWQVSEGYTLFTPAKIISHILLITVEKL